ncbi:hypothetical protein QTL95_27570 [Rhizobium sp. S152]|uniref:hypothetical protein n=1 Tax=Rhizobium sp. S152 TaxID=3055038 RepID=UPI0025A9FD19|nr:hypothetical protein [Rhizobium sp. S152]MDM9629648.1 hypothetical protein [Rhizobium sp. S152]
MSKKNVRMGSQTRPVRDGAYVSVDRDGETGKFTAAGSGSDPLRALGDNVAKSAVATKPVPLDPDAFMDYLLEEDAVIMEHLAK